MNKVNIIKTITMPLGFFVLALLIVESFLAIVLVGSNLSPENKILGVWLGVSLFVLVVIIVALLVAFKPRNLTFDGYYHLLESGKVPWGTDQEPISREELEKLSPSEEEE